MHSAAAPSAPSASLASLGHSLARTPAKKRRRAPFALALLAAATATGSASAALSDTRDCAACVKPDIPVLQVHGPARAGYPWDRWQTAQQSWNQAKSSWTAHLRRKAEREGAITRAFTDLSYQPPRPPKPQPAPLRAADLALLTPAQPYMKSVRRWAREFELPESLLLAVIHTESRFNPNARSHANAIGLMQLVAKRAGADAWHFITGEKRVPTEAELLDPDTNIRLGAAYLRMLKDHYWSDVTDPGMRRALVLASYNWGIGNVRRRLTLPKGQALEALQAAIDRRAPAETSGYLRSVQQRVQDYEKILVAGAEQLASSR